MKIREIITKDNIPCPNCDCNVTKKDITEGLGIPTIFKCTTCETTFNEEHVIKKKYSKAYALKRFLQ